MAKRARERARQERHQNKLARRAERRAEKQDRPDRASGEDPDIAGIVPGPQPLVQDNVEQDAEE
jgi:hypothetical protein